MSKLKIAIQKAGRLHDGSIQLLKDCGISIENNKDQLKTAAKNFPIEVLYLRNSDIPQYLEDGVADIAIIGSNLLIEKDKKVNIVEKLGFARCRLSLAIPKSTKFDGTGWFEGKKIATSHPKTLRAFLNKNNIRAEIHEISGSVEIAPNIGLADAVCDLVSSGNTLFKNGLKEVSTISRSEACLAGGLTLSANKKALLDTLIFRIQSVLRAKNTKYVMMNVPDNKIEEVSKLLPVLKSPTIMPLAIKGWSSLHSVIEEATFWEVVDQLRNAGAEGILIIPIEKIVT